MLEGLFEVLCLRYYVDHREGSDHRLGVRYDENNVPERKCGETIQKWEHPLQLLDPRPHSIIAPQISSRFRRLDEVLFEEIGK